MKEIDQIYRKISRLYEGIDAPGIELPLAFQAYLLADFAVDYLNAASVLDNEGHQFWLPQLQLTGHAMECVLKACLAAANEQPPHKHDLVELSKDAGDKGFTQDESGLATIVHLNHLYFRDLATGTKYKSRYPTNAVEQLGGTISSHSTFVTIIRDLIEQARHRTEPRYQEMFSTLRIHGEPE